MANLTSNQRPYCTYEGCKEACVDDENKRLREFLQLWIYEGRLQSFEDRERFRKAAQALVSGTPSPSETSGQQEDKADLLAMAALIARLGRQQSYHVPAGLLKRASAVLVELADSRTTRRHRGCGSDCGLPAGHLGDHVPPEEPKPERLYNLGKLIVDTARGTPPPPAPAPTPSRIGHIYSPREGTDVCFICGFHKSEHAPEHMPAEKASERPFERECDRCGKLVKTRQPVTSTVYYCSIECAE